MHRLEIEFRKWFLSPGKRRAEGDRAGGQSPAALGRAKSKWCWPMQLSALSFVHADVSPRALEAASRAPVPGRRKDKMEEA